MLPAMELRHLRYFVVVAEEQNVTRAAERLHVSQPPLSRQIRDLEQELGVSLFRRTAKSLALTEPGKIFLNEARAVLLRAEQAVQTVRSIAAGDHGQLRVGYAPSLTVQILPKALRAFESACPGVRISLHDLSTEECVQKLAAQKLDVALTVKPSGQRMRGLTFERVVTYPICCAVAVTHPLAKKRSISLAQLRQERLMGYSREEYPEYADWLALLFRPVPFDPGSMEEYDSATGLIAAVEAGRGVALVSTSMKCLTGPRVKLLPISPALPALVVGALSVKAPSDLVQRFILSVKKAA
jgi:LysR family transcriptional regulator, benzoate and cis,cis-muconate-responsive activator of ben and cat genes